MREREREIERDSAGRKDGITEWRKTTKGKKKTKKKSNRLCKNWQP